MIEQLFAKHNNLLNNLETSFTSNLTNIIQWDEKLIGIKGARGVGKTTLMLQYIKDKFKFRKECLYVSLDDIAFPYKNIVELAEAFNKVGGKHLFIDEIHKYPDWPIELKNIYDNFSQLQVVFSGSSILDLQRGKADLSRRAVMYNMQGLSFREFLQIETGQKFNYYKLEEILERHESISVEILENIKPFQHFENYLKRGYYPFYLQGLETYHIKLAEVLNLMLETDLPIISNIDFHLVNKLKRFLRLLSSDIPFKPNISNLAASIGMSWQSVIKYINYLSEADLINIVYPFGKNLKSMTKPEMIYLHHPNHFYVFSQEIQNKGNLRETFFLNQLSYLHKIERPNKGDFIVDEKFTFELGGKNKTHHQISGLKNSFVVADDIEYGFNNKIPIWLFGFLY
jgi:predicted AAA+ superfamily ATPase